MAKGKKFEKSRRKKEEGRKKPIEIRKRQMEKEERINRLKFEKGRWKKKKKE
jgi:hypothetical protein